MISTAELYDFATKRDILIINGKIKKVPAFAICDNGDCAIVIDHKKITSDKEEKVIVAHEIGHCETGSFYTMDTLETRSKCEYRADKWAADELMPREEIEKAFQLGFVEVWQLAEYFGLPDDFVRRSCEIYGYLDREAR